MKKISVIYLFSGKNWEIQEASGTAKYYKHD